MSLFDTLFVKRSTLAELGAKTESTFVEIVKDAPLKGSDEPSDPIPVAEMFEVGGTYRVKTDSGVFTAKCRLEHEAESGTPMHVVGNGKSFALADTGESFAALSLDYPGIGFIALFVDYNHGSTITVSKLQETVHPIDPKFTPGVLPVVELETEIPMTDTETVLTNGNDISKLEKAATENQPIIIKFRADNGSVCSVNFVRIDLEGQCIFTALFFNAANQIVMVIGKLGSSWLLQVSARDL